MFQRALEVNPSDRDARYWLDRLTHMIAEEQQQRRRQAASDVRDLSTGNKDDHDEENGDRP